MTTERKIEILENCKVLLLKSYKTDGICTAFFISMTLYERIETHLYPSSIVYHLGMLFIKHRPKHISDNAVPWWSKDEKGLVSRLSIIDKMILELKSQIRP